MQLLVVHVLTHQTLGSQIYWIVVRSLTDGYVGWQNGRRTLMERSFRTTTGSTSDYEQRRLFDAGADYEERGYYV